MPKIYEYQSSSINKLLKWRPDEVSGGGCGETHQLPVVISCSQRLTKDEPDITSLPPCLLIPLKQNPEATTPQQLLSLEPAFSGRRQPDSGRNARLFAGTNSLCLYNSPLAPILLYTDAILIARAR
jgi:hypothetical protein